MGGGEAGRFERRVRGRFMSFLKLISGSKMEEAIRDLQSMLKAYDEKCRVLIVLASLNLAAEFGLKGGPTGVREVALIMGMDPRAVEMKLLELEGMGVVDRVGGERWRVTDIQAVRRFIGERCRTGSGAL